MDGPAGLDPPWARWTIVGLLGLLALNALVASTMFVVRPDGSLIGIPHDWLDGTPFDSYLVPGILLGLLGVLSVAALLRQAKARRDAPWWSGVAASGYVVWIVVQAALMGSTRHPMQTLLQASVLAVAAVIGLLSLLQLVRRRQAMDLRD